MPSIALRDHDCSPVAISSRYGPATCFLVSGAMPSTAKVLVVGKVEGDAASDHGLHKVHFDLFLLLMGNAKSLNFEP